MSLDIGAQRAVSLLQRVAACFNDGATRHGTNTAGAGAAPSKTGGHVRKGSGGYRPMALVPVFSAHTRSAVRIAAAADAPLVDTDVDDVFMMSGQGEEELRELKSQLSDAAVLAFRISPYAQQLVTYTAQIGIRIGEFRRSKHRDFARVADVSSQAVLLHAMRWKWRDRVIAGPEHLRAETRRRRSARRSRVRSRRRAGSELGGSAPEIENATRLTGIVFPYLGLRL